MRRTKTVLRFATVAVLSAALASSARAEEALTGTGSAFAQPIYAKWADQQRASNGIQLNYQATGSSVGQTQILNGLVDFGASDVPMDPGRLKQGDLQQFPTVAGGYVFFVNVPNVKVDEIKLTGTILADIYMGAITRWDDPRIVGINPDVALPKINIVPFYHAGGSGGTYAVSTFLAKVSERWKTAMGVGMTLSWPLGVGVKGSFGAATSVPLTEGSIGYAEDSYVRSNKLTTVQLQNRAGAFLKPSGETYASAIENADWNSQSSFAVDLTYAPGEKSWPLVTPTFVLMPRGAAKAAVVARTKKFFAWAFAHGDDAARALHYVPLPANVKETITRSWAD